MGESVQISASAPADPATQTAENRPEPQKAPEALIGGKFKTQDDLLKAYKELESKLGQPKELEKAPEAEPKQGEPEANDEADDLTVKKAEAESQGLDFAPFEKEFQEKGELTDASYEKLGKLGISRDMVEAYIAGQQHKAASVTQEAYQAAGGKEQFDALREWMATDAVTDEERDTFNRSVLSKNPVERRMAIQFMATRYQEVVGTEGNLIGGRAPVGGNYESMAQMLEDLRNPKYKTDEAFRAMVDRKLERSPHLWKK